MAKEISFTVRSDEDPNVARERLENALAKFAKRPRQPREKGSFYPCGLRRLMTPEEKKAGHIWIGMTISNDHIPHKGEVDPRWGLAQLKNAVRDTRLYEKENGRVVIGASGKKYRLQTILRLIYPIFGKGKTMTNDALLSTCYDFGIDAAAMLKKMYVNGKWVYRPEEFE